MRLWGLPWHVQQQLISSLDPTSARKGSGDIGAICLCICASKRAGGQGSNSTQTNRSLELDTIITGSTLIQPGPRLKEMLYKSWRAEWDRKVDLHVAAWWWQKSRIWESRLSTGALQRETTWLQWISLVQSDHATRMRAVHVGRTDECQAVFLKMNWYVQGVSEQSKLTLCKV